MGFVDQSVAFLDRATVLRYSVAGIATLGALGIRMAVDPVLQNQAPYVPFILAVVLVSRIAGRGPGLLASVGGALAVAWFFLEPRYSFCVYHPAARAGLASFLLVSGLISVWLGRLRASLVAAKPGGVPSTPPEVSGTDTKADDSGSGDLRMRPHHAWLGAAVVLLVIEAVLFAATWSRLSERELWSSSARAQFGSIPAQELSHLMEKSERAESSAKGMGVVMACGAGLLMLVLLAGSRAIDRGIAERRRAEQQVAASERRFRSIFANAATGIVIANPDGKMQQCNPAFCRLLGYGEHELAGRSFVSLIPDEDLERNLDDVGRLRAGRVQSFQNESRYMRNDGETVWVQKVVSATVDAGGGIATFIALVTDITERRRADEALKRQKQQYETLAEHAPEVIARFDSDLRHVYINDYGSRVYGMDKAHILGRTNAELGFPAEQVFWQRHFEQALTTGKPQTVEFEFDSPTFGHQCFSSLCVPERDGNGSVTSILAITRDITDQKRNELALRHSEERYRTLFDSLDKGFCVIEVIFDNGGRALDYRFLETNPAFSRQTGLVDAVGRTMRELAPNHEAHWFEAYGRVAQTGIATRFEARAAALGRFYDVYAFRVSGPRPDRVGILFNDISERKLADLALRESEARQAFLVRMADALRLLADPVQIQFEACRLLGEHLRAGRAGYAECEADGENVVIARHYSDDLPGIEGRHHLHIYGATLAAELRTGRPIIRDDIARDARYSETEKSAYAALPVGAMAVIPLLKAERLVSVLFVHYREAHRFGGAELSLMEAVAERTWAAVERARAESALRDSEDRYRRLVESAADAIFVHDYDGRFIDVNRSACESLGYTHDELLSMSVFDVERDFDLARAQAAWARISEGDRVCLSGRHRRKDGAIFPVEAHIATFSAAGKKLFLGLVRDVSEREEAQERIRQLNAELEQRVLDRTAQLEAANQELEAFAYSVSHDLRAPLRGIDGWSLALAEDYGPQLDETAHKYLWRVRSETQRMGVLIDDLLKLSRLTRSEMQHEAVDMTGLAQSISARLIEAQPGRQIEFVIASGLSAKGDARLFEVALTNLLSNAVKFTGPREYARVEFGRLRGGERPFFVRDNGVGFDMKFAGTLFGAFQRLHKTSEFSGTGVGLATVQRVIHRHGGRVWAEASPGEGATFLFTVGVP
jgi:PAS domain S-box-containing protein